MAADRQEKKVKKSKWKKKGRIFDIGNKEKGQAFADLRKKKAVREYKKLLRKTREQDKLMPSAKKVGFSSVNIKPGEQLRADRSWREAVLTQGSESASAKIMSPVSPGDNSCFGHRRDKRRKRAKEGVTRFSAAEVEHKKRKLEKEEQLRILEEKRAKRDQELMEKVKKRRQTYSKLSRRTKRGQPVMANQMTHLLEKIQSQS